MKTIIFESHATSCDNEKGIASGHNDSPLSEKGILQAKELGQRYNVEDIQAVYCSDLSRSLATAKIAFAGRHLPIIEDARLREWDYGRLNGHIASEIESRKCSSICTPFPDGESLTMAVRRISAVIDETCSDVTLKAVLFIGHRALYYTLEHRFNKLSLEEIVRKPWQWQPGWRYLVNAT